MNQYQNFEAVALSGTQTFPIKDASGNTTAVTIHQIYCLTGGTIDITPAKGPVFRWTGSANSSINLCVIGTTVNSGGFIAFRSKQNQVQFIQNFNH